MFNDTTTTKMLQKVKYTINKTLKDKYQIDDPKIIKQFMTIHGLNKNRFDFMKNIETFINDILNDVSIDENSNKNDKTIEGLAQEATAPVRKAIGFDYLYRVLKEKYGDVEAKKLMGEMYDLSLGLSDSTNILKPYCWALDASRIIVQGRPFGQLYSSPAKRIASYISALCESVHQLSSHLAGAIAIGTFFTDIAHLSLYKEKYDLRDLKTNKEYRKYLENEMQQFVHSVNHLSRSGIESPFTNISIFDRVKLKQLVKGMDWFFPCEDLPISLPSDFDDEKALQEFCLEYIVDYIMEIQEIFINFFDKGDPLSDGKPYRFPIVTLNFSKKKYGDNYIIEDTKFLSKVCRKDIYRYNIFVSEGSKVASCCRLLSNSEMLDLAASSNSFGGSSISLGSHRVVTVNFNRIALESETEDEFYKLFDKRIENAAKILQAHKALIKQMEQKGLQQFISNGWIDMDRLFSTFGVLGIYEASKLYREKYNIDENIDVTEKLLIYFNDKVAEMSQKYNIIGNIEQIPGESFAIRLAKADKAIFGEDKVPYTLYANQFVPLWEDYSIWDKMEQDGKYNQLITGGGIVHVTIGEKVTSKQAEKLIKFSCKSGCEHFALNAIYSECEQNHITFGKHQVCPKCESKVNEWYSRIVGFFTPITSWQKERRMWEFPRRTQVDLK